MAGYEQPEEGSTMKTLLILTVLAILGGTTTVKTILPHTHPTVIVGCDACS
jgi:hypothetical protein